MIKFFRSIRYSLVEKNKTSKYFKYAIGEIVLVVIGILIALQINNWNEIQKTRRWEDRFLIDLRNELKNDLAQLKFIYRIQSTKVNALKGVKELVKTKDVSNKLRTDSLYKISQGSNPTFFPTTGVYDSGLSAGKIEHIKNDSLKYSIMNLYNHFYKRLVYNGEIMDRVVDRVDWENLEYYDSSKGEIRSWELAMDFKFDALIDFEYDQNIVYIKLVEQNLAEIELIIVAISNELDDD